MADDFRRELYNSYVTKFTGRNTGGEEPASRSQWPWYEYRYLPMLQKLDRQAPILELGCGAGTMLEFLKEMGFSRVTGIDISEEQICLAKNKRLDARVGDVFEYLEAAEDGIGAIIALDFLEHFTKAEVTRLLTLIHKALKAEGMLIVQTPNGQGLFPGQVIYDDFTHMSVFTPGSLEQILSLVGFAEIRFEETGPIPAGLVGNARKALWKITKVLANVIRRIEANKSQVIWTENLVCYCVKPT